jgi:hypothetical protein
LSIELSRQADSPDNDHSGKTSLTNTGFLFIMTRYTVPKWWNW